MVDKQIVLNSLTCLECGETMISHHTHDFKVCNCQNKATIDDDFELVRVSAERGSRGVSGKESLKWIKIADMDDDYLESVLEYGGEKYHLDLIRKEIEYRKNKKSSN